MDRLRNLLLSASVFLCPVALHFAFKLAPNHPFFTALYVPVLPFLLGTTAPTLRVVTSTHGLPAPQIYLILVHGTFALLFAIAVNALHTYLDLKITVLKLGLLCFLVYAILGLSLLPSFSMGPPE